jgi:hypothetical protein
MQARSSALFFLKDLPVGPDMRFNIVVFGSNHKTYASSCQEVTQENVAKAVAWVQTNVSAGQHVEVVPR